MNSQALDPLEIIGVTEWEGLSFALVRREMDPLCTNKLTQEEGQRRMKFCCSGGKTKIIITFFWYRSGDVWWVKEKGYHSFALKSTKADNPFLPPTSGWTFFEYTSYDNGKGCYVEDPSLKLTLPSTLPPCCLTLTLSGAAEKSHKNCEGEYKSTGLISMGRPVNIFYYNNIQNVDIIF